jgi:hypothetical protein
MRHVKVHRSRYQDASLWADPLEITCEVCGAEIGEECTGSELDATIRVAILFKDEEVSDGTGNEDDARKI